MSRVLSKIFALFAALAWLAGCSSTLSGQIEENGFFIPLLGFARAYLCLDLTGQNQEGGLIIKYLDFTGKRVGLEIVTLPNPKNRWGWSLGRGAKREGQAFFALRIERYGDKSKPVPYTFQPLAGSNPGPCGPFNRPPS